VTEVFVVDDLITLFNELFFDDFETELVKGEGEPVYLPKDDTRAHNQIVFAHGFYSSALHEIAHWCLAGKARRATLDYGYWYCPDGRDAQQQIAFQQVEVKPQAIEWVLSMAVGLPFRLSNDNLDGDPGDPQAFRIAVWEQTQEYLAHGLPARAQFLKDALLKHYDRVKIFHHGMFSLDSLR
jgi:elongation factor P hydroxylase